MNFGNCCIGARKAHTLIVKFALQIWPVSTDMDGIIKKYTKMYIFSVRFNVMYNVMQCGLLTGGCFPASILRFASR